MIFTARPPGPHSGRSPPHQRPLETAVCTWAKDKLKKQLKLIQEKGTVICSTARELMTVDGELTGYIIPVKTEYSYLDLRLQNQINCSSVLIRTEVAREFPMHHDDSHEDYLMWLEVLKKPQWLCSQRASSEISDFRYREIWA